MELNISTKRQIMESVLGKSNHDIWPSWRYSKSYLHDKRHRIAQLGDPKSDEKTKGFPKWQRRTLKLSFWQPRRCLRNGQCRFTTG